MATPTGVGSVSVQATGQAGVSLLAAINAALVGVTPVTATSSNLPAAPTTGGVQYLNIPTSISGNLAIPTGYTVVTYNNDGSTAGALTGGTSVQAVVGDNLNYTGGAGTVAGFGSVGGTINDSTAGAQIVLDAASVSGSPSTAGYTVTATGAGDVISFESGRNIVTATGGGDTFRIDSGTNSITGGSGDTVLASGGSSTINAGGGDLVLASGSASINYVGSTSSSAGASTILGGASNVITANSQAISFYETSGASDVLVGGTKTLSAFLAANSTVTAFSESGGSNYYLSGNASLLAITGLFTSASTPAVDNIYGGTSPVTAFVLNNDDLNLFGTAPSATVVIAGANDTVNALGSQGKNTYIAEDVDTKNTTVGGNTPFSGNTTLIASGAGSDTFDYFSTKLFGSQFQPGAPATFTIQDWKASDQVALIGFTGADQQGVNAAAAAAVGGTTSSYKLSDGSTFTFLKG